MLEAPTAPVQPTSPRTKEIPGFAPYNPSSEEAPPMGEGLLPSASNTLIPPGDVATPSLYEISSLEQLAQVQIEESGEVSEPTSKKQVIGLGSSSQAELAKSLVEAESQIDQEMKAAKFFARVWMGLQKGALVPQRAMKIREEWHKAEIVGQQRDAILQKKLGPTATLDNIKAKVQQDVTTAAQAHVLGVDIAGVTEYTQQASEAVTERFKRDVITPLVLMKANGSPITEEVIQEQIREFWEKNTSKQINRGDAKENKVIRKQLLQMGERLTVDSQAVKEYIEAASDTMVIQKDTTGTIARIELSTSQELQLLLVEPATAAIVKKYVTNVHKVSRQIGNVLHISPDVVENVGVFVAKVLTPTTLASMTARRAGNLLAPGVGSVVGGVLTYGIKKHAEVKRLGEQSHEVQSNYMSAQKADEILDQKQKQQDQYAAKNWIGKIKEVVAHGGEMSLLDLQAAAAKGFTNHNIENISAQDRIQQLQEMIAHLQSGMLDQSLREKAIALEVETRLRYNIGEKAGYSLLPQDRTGDEVSIPHELILYRKALQEAGISAQEIHTYEKAEARDIEYRYTYAVADIKAYYDEAIATWAHRNALKAAAPGAMLGALAGGLIAYEMPDIHHISQQVAGSLHENFVQAQHSIVTTTNHTIENFLKQNSGTAHAATLDTHVSMNGLAHQHVLQTAHMDQETTRGILNHDLPPVQVESKDFDASWNDNATTHIGTITYEHGPVEQTLNNGIDDQGRFYIQGDPGANALVVNVPDNPGHINGPMVVELSNQHNLTFDVKNPADLASKVTILQNGVKHQITKAQLLQYMVAGNSPESYAKTVANYTKWYAHQVAIGGPTGSEYYYMENPTENNIFTANISTAYVAQHNGVMDIDYHATIQGHGLHPNHVQVPEVQPRVKDPLAEIKTDVQTNMGGRYTVEERGYEDIVSIDGKPSAVVQLVDPQMRDYKISWLDSQGQLHAEMLYDKTPLEVSQALSQDAIQNPDNVSHFMEVGDMGSHEILFVDTKYAIHPDTGIISNGVNPVGRASFNGDQMTITSLDGSHHVTIQGKDGTFALRDNDIAQLQLTTEPSPVPTQGPKPIETPTATVPGTTDSGGVNVGQAIANAQANVAVQAVEAGAGIIGSGVAGAVAVNKGMGAYRRRNPNLAPLPITVNVAPLPDRTNVHAVDAYLQTSLAPEPQDIPDRQQAMDDFEQQYVALQDVINLSSSPVQDVFTFIENNPQAFLGLTAIQSLPAVDTLINKLSSSLDEIEGARDEAVDIDRIIKSSGLSTILDANTDYRNYLHNLHYSVITANALQEEIVRDYLDPLISAVLAKNIIETWKSKHPLQPVTPIPPNNPVSPPAPPQPNINVPPITPLPRAPRPPVQPLRTRVQSAINRVDRAILDRRNRAAYKSTQELGLATTVNIGGNKPPLDLATYEPDPKFDGRLELVTMGSYEIGAGSDRGVDRRAKEDEDSFEIATIASVENGQPVEETLLILADGMGGQSFGKEASRLVVKHTREKYADIRKNQPQKTSADALTEAVLFANDMVYKENVKLGLIGPNQKPMGSTCVAAVMKKNGSYIIANVGDSRAYKVTSKKIEQLTDDQSVVASLVKAGSITPQDIYTHKRRNEIWGTMGNTTSIQVDISVSTENLKKGEQLVLCCDGLWEMTKDAYGGVIQKFARSTGNQKEVARRLIAKALLGDGLDSSGKPNKGGLDNITVISAMKVA